MAKELLIIPEERLLDVCRVIRAGLATFRGSGSKLLRPDSVAQLTAWCEEMEAYAQALSDPTELRD